MKEAPINENEDTRLAALEKLNILYSPAEERFDQITRLASHTFKVPIALVSLISEKCQWFKSSQGLITPETEREISFCGHAIASEDIMVVEDTLLNPDFADNPLVSGPPHIRFYAGCPISANNGNKLGTLCIIDTQPRTLDISEQDYLRSLTNWVEHELEKSTLSAAQLDLIKNNKELERKNMLDPVTHIWNNKGIIQVFEREQFHAQQFSLFYSLFLLSITELSSIKKQYGVETGNTLLYEISQRIRTGIRPEDAIARYSDNEFVVLLSDCKNEDAEHIVGRLLRRLAEREVKTKQVDISPLIHVGITTCKDISNTSLDDIVARSQQALKKAKQNPGNTFSFV